LGVEAFLGPPAVGQRLTQQRGSVGQATEDLTRVPAAFLHELSQQAASRQQLREDESDL
jgi:hypothetical protein